MMNSGSNMKAKAAAFAAGKWTDFWRFQLCDSIRKNTARACDQLLKNKCAFLSKQNPELIIDSNKLTCEQWWHVMVQSHFDYTKSDWRRYTLHKLLHSRNRPNYTKKHTFYGLFNLRHFMVKKSCFYQSATLYRTRTVQGFCSVRYGTVFSDFRFRNWPCTVTVYS